MTRPAAAAVVLGLVVVIGTSAASGKSPMILDKQGILDHQFAIPTGAAPPAPKDRAFVPPYDSPRPQIELGTVTAHDVQAPVSPVLFTPTTQWVDVVGGIQLAVYGGSASHEGGAGAIYVWITDLDAGRDLPGTGLFVAAGHAGPLELTSVAANVASFDDPSGGGTFDVSTHEFRRRTP